MPWDRYLLSEENETNFHQPPKTSRLSGVPGARAAPEDPSLVKIETTVLSSTDTENVGLTKAKKRQGTLPRTTKATTLLGSGIPGAVGPTGRSKPGQSVPWENLKRQELPSSSLIHRGHHLQEACPDAPMQTAA